MTIIETTTYSKCRLKASPDLDHGEDNNLSLSTSVNANVLLLNICSNGTLSRHGFYAKVSSIIVDASIPVSLFLTSDRRISIAVDARQVTTDPDLTIVQKRLSDYGVVTVSDHLAILSITLPSTGAGGDRSAFRIVSALSACGIESEMVSYGATQPTISCMLRKEDVSRALETLNSVSM
ncbi:hypothetical protein ASPZODRAFT_135446 [Penicilliopsis zonata CBS 506.65]|uniref:aspartate kinase n=1 Tax=Penicilliopsis zonata CBS 506.65 TaxID=1073090 RepID=A0A1L9SA03_9EURO|nr:hypothetical protein ASPZODRAFT_135446 [Penicilliopsis zonata CBS 506.65]OJJ44013.1 hypothetical protein ASPZODRAFT_135446 [Penicilliopsis zonata CBS 506.65]